MTAPHAWDVSTDRAKQIQSALRHRIAREPLPAADELETVAGADISYDRGSDRLYAAVVVMTIDTLDVLTVGSATMTVPFPYVPGLLSFREGPALLRAFAELDRHPDVLICDGHGYAHPRRFGLASHIGLWLDRPTIGVAKNVLVGNPAQPASNAGHAAPLRAEDTASDPGETIGAVVRTRTDVHPVYVSVGHRATLSTAIDVVLEVSPTYKIPEPIRRAHSTVNDLRREA